MHCSTIYRPEEGPAYEDDEIDLVELSLILWKYRFIIIFFIVFGICIATIYSISRPRQFTTKTSIINMLDNKVLKSSRGFDFDTLVHSPRNNILLAILNSHTLREQIVKSSDLLPLLFPDRWDTEKKEWVDKGKIPSVKKGAKRLKNSVKVETNTTRPTISIIVTTCDPELSALIANSYTRELEIYLKNNTFSSVKKSRLFLEKQLDSSKNELDALKKKMEEFQKNNGVFDLKRQIAASIEAYNKNAQLLNEYETERKIIEAISSPYNPKVLNLSKRIDTIKSRMDDLKKGHAPSPVDMDDVRLANQNDSNPTRGHTFIPLERIPYLKMEMAKLEHEILMQQKIYDLIVESYEKITIQESKDKIFINVLDRAEVPEGPTGKNTKMLICIGGLAGLCMGIFFAFVREFFMVLRLRFIESKKQTTCHSRPVTPEFIRTHTGKG